MFNLAVGITIAYFCGAIPFGIVVTRIVKGVDVRSFGSGSSGFTNVYRVAGICPGIIVAFLDIAKGFVAVMLVASCFHHPDVGISITHFQIICGCAAVLGHIFTIFARFKGGKGVLTSLGVCVGLFPFETGIAVAVFVIVFALSRYISAGSLVAAASLPLIFIGENLIFQKEVDNTLLVLACVLAVVIFYAHRENIKRLIRGEENKFKRLKV